MDTFNKIVWAFAVLLMGANIASLRCRVDDLETKVDYVPRYIEKNCPSEYDVADISDYRIKKFFAPNINVGDKKGTNE